MAARKVVTVVFLLIVASALYVVYFFTPLSSADNSFLQSSEIAPFLFPKIYGSWQAFVQGMAAWWQQLVDFFVEGDTSLAPRMYLLCSMIMPWWAIDILTVLAIMLIINQLLHIANFNFTDLPAAIIITALVAVGLPLHSGLISPSASISVLWSSALVLTAIRAFFAERRRKGLRWFFLTLIGSWLSIWATIPVLIGLTVKGIQMRFRWRRRQWCIYIGLALGFLLIIVPGIVLHIPVEISSVATSPLHWLYRLWHDCYILLALMIMVTILTFSQAGRWIMEKFRPTCFWPLLTASFIGWIGACLFSVDPLGPVAMHWNYDPEVIIVNSPIDQAALVVYQMQMRIGGILFWFPQLFALGGWIVIASALNIRPQGGPRIITNILCAVLAILVIWYMVLTVIPLFPQF